jgi:hypothetical protein
MTLKTIAGDYTQEKFNALKKAYAKALEAKQASFKFEGNELLVPFAKYLIEYLGTRFK